MSMLDKDKGFADRIADINQQVQTGDVNFEQASRYALDCNDCGGWLVGLWLAENRQVSHNQPNNLKHVKSNV